MTEYSKIPVYLEESSYINKVCSGLVHWEDPEGWDGEGGGRGDRDGEHT